MIYSTRYTHNIAIFLRTYFVVFLFFAGILFRMWFIGLNPQPFWSDQQEYETYAARIFHNPWMLASHSYRSYPYPLILAVVYKIVGFGNHQAVYFLQAVLDSLVGFMIYAILRFGLKNTTAAWIGFILYTLNPFTGGYVGVILAEVLTGFFITGTILLGLLFVKKSNPYLWGVFRIFCGPCCRNPECRVPLDGRSHWACAHLGTRRKTYPERYSRGLRPLSYHVVPVVCKLARLS